MKKQIIILLTVCLLLVSCVSAQKKVEQSRENSPEYQYNMGLFFLNEGKPDLAIPHFNRSIALRADNYLSQHALGIAYSMKGELEQAASFFQKALQINPQSSETRNNLGMVYQEMGFLDKAEIEYKAAIADKNYASKALPHYNLARLYVMQEKLQEAVFQLESALKRDPRFVMAYSLKGNIMEQLDRYRDAVSCYRGALDSLDTHFADDTDIQFNLARAYYHIKEYNQSRRIFEQIYNLVSDPAMKKEMDDMLAEIKKIRSV
ncbi:MAG: tetratricopeptide repeat protein [Acidobacteria bacterium]|nr:tetratricopeptide repeat protein [Acidobacteriota bacterium]MBU4328964.1 tetratricopeptide repeat protein [Acidobacteriota bacterium]